MFWESMENEEAVSPLEMFRSEFPDAMAELTEAANKDAVEKAKEGASALIEKAVEAERTRVRTELMESFERQLKDALVGLREDLTREIREEYEADPAVGAAKAALAQIVEMVGAYRQTPDEKAVQDALKARELEVAAAKGAAEQSESRAVQAERLLKLEQKLSGHALAKSLRNVLAPVVAKSGAADLEEQLDALIEEASALVPPSLVEEKVTERVALTEARAELVEKKNERSQLLEQVVELKDKLRRAVEIGHKLDGSVEKANTEAATAAEQVEDLEAKVEELTLEVYKRDRIMGMPITNKSHVLKLLEAADSKSTVDRVIAESGAKAMVDGDLEQARRAIRGAAPGAAAFQLEEGAAARVAGAPDDAVDRSGLSANDLAALSGVSQ
jgi:hypothetical protein